MTGYIAAADFNGDGVPDLAEPNQDPDGTAAILLTQPTLTVTATIRGIAPAEPAQVDASYPGDSHYSASVSGTTAVQPQVATPVFSPAPGTYTSVQTVTITDSTPGATIYYWLGPSSSPSYTAYLGPITISGPGQHVLEVYATAPGFIQSNLIQNTYVIVIPAPVPGITSLSPALAAAGGSSFTLTVNGSNFTTASTIEWNSTALTTQFVSATQLTAQVSPSAIATAGIAPVTVQTPAPGGGTSNSVEFEVDTVGSNTPPSMNPVAVTVTAGTTGTYNVTLPSSATNVSVTCLNLPLNATCNYSASAATLTIATAASTPVGTYVITSVFTETVPGAAAAIILLPLLLAPFAGAKKRKAVRILLWGSLGFAIAIATASGCGGGGGGLTSTTPATHQVTSSATITLVVN
jgi:hypothetical protein